MHRRTGLAAVVLALVLAAGDAVASPIANAIAGLHAALQTRVAVAGIARREKNGLTSADTALAGVDGDFDAADLTGLQGVGHGLVASRTHDATVLAAAAAVAQCLVDEAEAREDEIVDALVTVLNPHTKAAIQTKINRARAAVTAAQALAATNPGAAISALRAALSKYAAVQARVTAALAAQAAASSTSTGAGPFTRSGLSSRIFNPTMNTYVVKTVFADVIVVPQTSASFHLSADVTSFVPGAGAYALPFMLQPNRFYDLHNAISYAVTPHVGTGEFYSFHGSVQIQVQGHGTYSFVVQQ